MKNIRHYLSVLRIRHWLKSLFLFAAPFFGGKLFDDQTLAIAFPVFMAFSLSASAAYIFNDIVDMEKDSHHPKKKHRSLAAGNISRTSALISAALLLFLSFGISYKIAPTFLYYILLYLVIQAAYSLYLKNVAIADIFCIALGFIIRILAGGAAFHVEVSKWLFMTMFMVSLVLAAGKRLGEINTLNDSADMHRKTLAYYSSVGLNEILLIASAVSLVAYSLYVIEQFQKLIYTIPIVTFGLFRYMMLAKKGLGDPTDAMTKDKWLALTVAAWLLLVGFIRYS